METETSAAPLRDLLQRARVLPVLTVNDVPQSLQLVEALAAGGLKVVEVTLRSKAALPAIEAIAKHLPEVTVGAGTLTSPDQFTAVAKAGGTFAVSPGFTSRLAQAAVKSGLPWLPGVATAGEAMIAGEEGLSILKLFPAEAVGGLALLKSLRGPLPDFSFCPTGGIKDATYRDYLALPNVLCVGGSWMVPKEVVAAGGWTSITRLAREISG